MLKKYDGRTDRQTYVFSCAMRYAQLKIWNNISMCKLYNVAHNSDSLQSSPIGDLLIIFILVRSFSILHL